MERYFIREKCIGTKGSYCLFPKGFGEVAVIVERLTLI